MSEHYTLDQARDELKRRECAEGGHRPSIEARDVDQDVGEWLCDCGAIRWRPAGQHGPTADYGHG